MNFLLTTLEFVLFLNTGILASQSAPGNLDSSKSGELKVMEVEEAERK